jgi:predicted Fe-Mo cluster-binding NifX family protein
LFFITKESAMQTRVAVPSVNPGGLEAALMPHFGHCDVFTIVTMQDGVVTETQVLPNMPHEAGGCIAPVKYLADHGITALLAGGMGMRPLQAFLNSGIQVFFAGVGGTVNKAVQDFSAGRLPAFGDNGLCKGGCGGAH